MTPPDPSWLPNKGEVPKKARGKRVRVILAHGREGSYSVGAGIPSGWAADGKGGCRWSLTGSPYDIAFYKVL